MLSGEKTIELAVRAAHPILSHHVPSETQEPLASRPFRTTRLLAAVFTVTWLCAAYAVSSFSEQLPELDQIYYQSATLSALGFALAATLILSVLPGRSLRRSLTTYAIGMAMATYATGKSHWEQRQAFDGERLTQARKQRQLELLAERNAEKAFATALEAAKAKASPPVGSSSR